ncbi:HNH endonuclease [Peribacillus frigoritolerans]|uniref:HNH endonuclease n=1 Tax=Peribacillus frigoritolerans TaxID=450367 RepID=UPI0037FB6F94
MIGSFCKMYKTCSICGRVKYFTKFASNGRGKSRRKSHCHECKYFKRKGSKDIFNVQILEKSSIAVAVKIKSKKRVFYSVPYEDAARMVTDRTAGIVNSSLIHQFNIREILLERDGYICKYCGGAGNTIDHVIPRCRGGRTTLSNCVCACKVCNKEKGSLSVSEFQIKRRKTNI